MTRRLVTSRVWLEQLGANNCSFLPRPSRLPTLLLRAAQYLNSLLQENESICSWKQLTHNHQKPSCPTLLSTKLQRKIEIKNVLGFHPNMSLLWYSKPAGGDNFGKVRHYGTRGEAKEDWFNISSRYRPSLSFPFAHCSISSREAGSAVYKRGRVLYNRTLIVPTTSSPAFSSLCPLAKSLYGRLNEDLQFPPKERSL